jgi:hypothetical protein
MENWMVGVGAAVLVTILIILLDLHVHYERDKDGRSSFMLEKTPVGRVLLAKFVELLGRIWRW